MVLGSNVMALSASELEALEHGVAYITLGRGYVHQSSKLWSLVICIRTPKFKVEL